MTLLWGRSPRRASRRRTPSWLGPAAALLVASAGAIALFATVLPVAWSPALVLLASQLLVLTVAAQCCPVQLLPNTSVLATTAPLFASVLLLPLPLAVALAATAVLTAALLRHEQHDRHDWLTIGFTVAPVAVAAAAATACGWTPGTITRGPTNLLPVAPLAAAAGLYATNLLLAELALAWRLRRVPWHGFWTRWPASFLQEGTLFLLGALFVRTALHAPWLLGLMAVPLVVVYRSLRDAMALRASEARFRALAHHALDVVLVVDAQERLQYVSAAAAQLFGVPAAALARDSLLARIHPEDRAVVQAVLAGAESSTDGTVHVVRCRHQTGDWRHAEVRCTDLRQEPSVAGLVLVLRDISERRRAEQAQALLVEATGRFAASLDEDKVLDELVHLTVPTLADWGVVERLDEGGAFTPMAIAHPDTAAASALAATIKTPRATATATPSRAALLSGGQSSLIVGRTETVWPQFFGDGRDAIPGPVAAPMSLLVVPLRHGERLLGILSLATLPGRRPLDAADQDLIESLASRAALCVENSQLYAQAHAALRERDDFFAAASHDLRTPVTTIAGFTQLLARRLERLEVGAAGSDCLELVQGIEQGTRRLAGQIDQLLDVSRRQAGDPPVVHRTPTDLVAIVRVVIGEQQRLSPRHRFVVDLGAPTCQGLWDPARVDRIVSNLVSNAVKYSPGGGQVVVRVMEELDGEGAWATLRVEDEGVGIPAGEQARIFERYYRASTVDPRIAGSGLGLANVAELVRQHGGQITVDSSLGSGARFRVRLPVRQTGTARMLTAVEAG